MGLGAGLKLEMMSLLLQDLGVVWQHRAGFGAEQRSQPAPSTKTVLMQL